MKNFDKEYYETHFQLLINSDINDKKVWEELWTLVDFCCSNMCKMMLREVRITSEQFEIRYGEAVLEIMEKIKYKDLRPLSLCSYAYWPCRRALINKACRQEDLEKYSFEDYLKGDKDE